MTQSLPLKRSQFSVGQQIWLSAHDRNGNSEKSTYSQPQLGQEGKESWSFLEEVTLKERNF